MARDTDPEWANIDPVNPKDRKFRLSWLQGRDAATEKQIMDWIEKISGQKANGEDLATWLKDGQVLCKLVNKVQPEAGLKVHSKGDFKFIENVDNFRRAAVEYGVPHRDCFETADLWEHRCIARVVTTLIRFAEQTQKQKQIPMPDGIKPMVEPRKPAAKKPQPQTEKKPQPEAKPAPKSPNKDKPAATDVAKKTVQIKEN